VDIGYKSMVILVWLYINKGATILIANSYEWKRIVYWFRLITMFNLQATDVIVVKGTSEICSFMIRDDPNTQGVLSK